MNITKGKQKRPVKHVIYGPAGIGKSTLASYYPRPLFLDTEEGSGQLDVARAEVKTMSDLGQSFSEILSGLANEFATIVIDVTDNLWRFAADSVCAENRWKNIETPDYGKGYVFAFQRFEEIIDTLDEIHKLGFNVVAVNHTDVVTVNPPETDAFTKYTLKQSTAPNKQAAKAGARLLEWADSVFFCHQLICTSSNGKAVGDCERVIELAPHPAWDAKNRYGFSERMPLCEASIRAILERAGAMDSAPGIPEEQSEPTVATAAPTHEGTLPFDAELLTRYFRATGRLQDGQGLENLNKKLRDAISARPADAMAAAQNWESEQKGGHA